MERIEFKDESCKKARNNAIEEFADKMFVEANLNGKVGLSNVMKIKKQMLEKE